MNDLEYTPYPRTPMTREFRERGWIVNEREEEYDGTTAVVQNEHLTAEEIEFFRWRRERWMKLRHTPAAFAHCPWFILRYGLPMLGHIFRGSSLKSILGLESQRKVFERSRRLRARERCYL